MLHLKEGEHDFADDYRIRSLVRKYSDHIAFPVRMPSRQKDEKDAPASTRPSITRRRCGRVRAPK